MTGDGNSGDRSQDAAGAPKRPRRMAVEVRRERRFDHPIFKLDEVDIDLMTETGDVVELRKQIVLRRPDAVAVLAYDPDRREVVLVEQFRAPARRETQSVEGDGWLIETIAGMLPPEAGRPSEARLRQAAEHAVVSETGLTVRDLDAAGAYLPSPGGATEQVHFFLAQVANAAEDGRIVRGRDKSEQPTRIRVFGYEEFFDEIRANRLQDAKIAIAAQIFQQRVIDFAKKQEAKGPAIDYEVLAAGDRVIGLQPGDLKHVQGVDAWVNSENIYYRMARIQDASYSGRIRTRGAIWTGSVDEAEDGAEDAPSLLVHDSVARQLRKRAGAGVAALGDVVSTPPCGLRDLHGVKLLVHVASVYPDDRLGDGRRTELAKISKFVLRALLEIDRVNRRPWRVTCRSVLLPSFGAGFGGLTLREVFPHIVDATLKFYKRRPNTTIERVLISLYSQFDFDLSRDALDEDSRLRRKVEIGP